MTIPAKTEQRLTKAANILIIAWCLLPLAAVLSYAFYTARMIQYENAGVTLFYSALSAEEQKVQAANYWHSMARDAYYSMFDFLGFFTIVEALFIAAYWISTLRRSIVVGLKEKPWIILLTAVLAASVISCIASDNPSLCWSGNDYRHEGLYSYIVYGGLMVCVSFLPNGKKITCVKLLAISGTVVGVLMLCQYYNIPHFNDITNSCAAVFFNSNHLGYYLNIIIVVCAGIFIFEHNIVVKVLYALVTVILVYALVINDTFGSYLAAGTGLVLCAVLASLKNRRFSVTALIPLLLFVGISILTSVWSYGNFNVSSVDISEISVPEQTPSADVASNFTTVASDIQAILTDESYDHHEMNYVGTGRMGIWRESITHIFDSPIIGYGPDGLDPDFYIIEGYGRPHNEFLQYALFAGIPAALCYITALVLIFLRQIKHINRLPSITVIAAGAVIAYVISSMFGNTTFYITPYFFLLLGMAMDTKELQD